MLVSRETNNKSQHCQVPCMESTCQAPQILTFLVQNMEDMEEDAQLTKGKTR